MTSTDNPLVLRLSKHRASVNVGRKMRPFDKRWANGKGKGR